MPKTPNARIRLEKINVDGQSVAFLTRESLNAGGRARLNDLLDESFPPKRRMQAIAHVLATLDRFCESDAERLVVLHTAALNVSSTHLVKRFLDEQMLDSLIDGKGGDQP